MTSTPLDTTPEPSTSKVRRNTSPTPMCWNVLWFIVLVCVVFIHATNTETLTLRELSNMRETIVSLHNKIDAVQLTLECQDYEATQSHTVQKTTQPNPIEHERIDPRKTTSSNSNEDGQTEELVQPHNKQSVSILKDVIKGAQSSEYRVACNKQVYNTLYRTMTSTTEVFSHRGSYRDQNEQLMVHCLKESGFTAEVVKKYAMSCIRVGFD